MTFDLETLFDELNEGLYLVNTQRVIQRWNRAAEKITGYSAEEVVGKRCADNILCHVDETGTPLCVTRCPLADTMADEQPREARVYLRHKDGHRVPVKVRATALRNESGLIAGGAELFSDASEQEAALQRLSELEELAALDPLTRLANRRYLEEQGAIRLAELERYGIGLGVLFLDIDHFKSFNDEHGHEMGDRVLVTVARTLEGACRPFDLFGRWGGEEFVGLLRNVDGDSLRTVAERCRALVEQSRIPGDRGELKVTISVGATLVQPGENLEQVLARADKLMYVSKKSGRNRVSCG
ncbi:MAG: sensor domain-containing diguanylate cyclase [Geothermobacteraceae bacterium]